MCLLNYSLSSMLNYKNTIFLIIGNIKGEIIIFDSLKKETIKIYQLHKGNISSIGFVSNWEYFFTASGSFSQNHDNQLKIYKLEIWFKDVFLKNIKKFNHHHGKIRGILCAKSSNKINDFIIITNGGIEDTKISIIDCKKKTKLFDIELLKGIYNFNFLYGDNLNKLIKNYSLDNNLITNKNKEKDIINDNENICEDNRIIFASSINEWYAIIYTSKENNYNSHIFYKINLSNQNGSNKSTMQIFKNNNNGKYFLLVSNISGSIECFEINEFVKNNLI